MLRRLGSLALRASARHARVAVRAVRTARPARAETGARASVGSDTPLERKISAEVDQVYDTVLRPLDQFKYIVPRKRTPMPMVLMVGNHSSGKSTFINYLLGQTEQDTGLAPTDDSFTVITTEKEIDGYNQDGNALISTSRWGFTDLDRLGPHFASKLRLKVRAATENFPEGILLVDTPGAIDATADAVRRRSTTETGTPDAEKAVEKGFERGYDFLQAVNWFAERADVVCLFFDPNNPGTTRETLDVLTQSLRDLDYKLMIILNKVDQFQLVHDFARAYGSLCWNLAKVIPRKDLPKIHSMFVPTPENSDIDKTGVNRYGIPMTDFIEARRQVIYEVRSAPKRRIDNLLTRVYNTTRRLKMTSVVADAARTEYVSTRTRLYLATTGLFSLAGLAAAGGIFLDIGLELALAVAAIPAAAGGVMTYTTKSRLAMKKKEILDSLTQLFEKKYYMDLENESQHKDLLDMWEGIKPRLHRSLELRDLGNSNEIKRLSRKQLDSLDNILNHEVARWRRMYEENRDR